MVVIRYILIFIFFIGCTKIDFENILIKVTNNSSLPIKKLCIHHTEGSECIDLIEKESTEKLELSISRESSLYISYEINNNKIYDKYNIGTYIDSSYYGYFLFFIDNDKLKVIQNLKTPIPSSLDFNKLDRVNEEEYVIDKGIIIEK